jgi:hypothetical protein
VACASLALVAVSAPSQADTSTPTCDDPVAVHDAVVSAQQTLGDAQAVWKVVNRPLGRMVAAKRHQAKADLVAAQTEARVLRRELRHTHSVAAAQEVRSSLRAEHQQAAHARNLLQFKRAALAEVKAQRAAARLSRDEATSDLAELQADEAACAVQADS